MKLIKHDIEITMDQLNELYQASPVDLNNMLESACCYHCRTGETIKTFNITLTSQNAIRLEGICKSCGNLVHGYLFNMQTSWFKFLATNIQIGAQRFDYVDYMKELSRKKKLEKNRSD